MKASIAHAIRPSVLILGKDSRKTRWTPTDIVLAKAYQRFLEELCQQCGQPKYICHNDSGDIEMKVKYDVCEAAKKAEARQADIVKETKKNPVYGQRVYAVGVLSDQAKSEGREISDYRIPYLTEQAKKMGLIPEEGDSE